jgi:cytochrome c oxidase subunit 2
MLTLVLTVGSAVILLGVMAVALYAFKGKRRGRRLREGTFVGALGLVFPAVTLLGLLIYALILSDAFIGREQTPALIVEAVAEQWEWTFSYPGVAGTPSSKDVLHLPAGEPVLFRVTSKDVIHSFWLPRLGGKIDAIPGRINTIVLEAGEPGALGGLCAEFCGVGHSVMAFDVIVHEPARFPAVLAELEGD